MELNKIYNEDCLNTMQRINYHARIKYPDQGLGTWMPKTTALGKTPEKKTPG